MSRKKRKEQKERKRSKRPIDSASIKRLIATRLADKLTENPEEYAKLVSLGLVDADTVARLPDELEFGAVVTQFRDRLAELAKTEPSVLKQLEVRPLDVLRPDDDDDDEKLAQSHRVAQVPRTVLFSDLEGFTTFTSDRGDLEASALLSDHYDAVDAIVRSRGGHVVKTIGDGHMLSFEQPAAAVMAAVDLVAAAPDPLRLRAGGHLGMVVATEQDLMGHVVNVAARVTDLAAGGVSIVTTDVRDAAGRLPRILFEPSHAERVDGLDIPLEVCEVHAA